MTPRKLKLLAISDTHLGEETSLLSFPRGLQHLWSTLVEDPDFWQPIFGDWNCSDERVEVEDLVLVGDIVDRTLSSTSQISAHAHAFAMMLGDALKVKHAVYVPGNHDHTLWTSFKGGHGITDPQGDTVVSRGKCCKKAEEMLSIFLGYPIGWAWWTLERSAAAGPGEFNERATERAEFTFSIANPVFAKTVKERTYAFAHGTHFRPELVPGWQRKLLQVARVSHLDQFAHLDLEPMPDLDNIANMAELESAIAHFVDSLWPSSKNKPTSRSDELWYLFTLLREGSEDVRTPPDRSAAFPRDALQSDAASDRFARLTGENDGSLDESLQRFERLFRKPLDDHLKDNGFSVEDLAFVYGDTHRGGWGELTPPDRLPIRVYNCGGWIAEVAEVPEVAKGPQTHPACHLFAVDEEGQEYMLDVSFKQDHEGNLVCVGEDELLTLASQDVEHRRRAVNRASLALGRGWETLKEILQE